MGDSIVIAVALLSFLMAFSIGANDAANALATSYGSNAMRLLYLVILGSIFEFIGAFFCSSHVAGTLVDSVIEDVDDMDQVTLEKAMLASSIASFLFIMSSSVFGMPISGTHTVVGALIGSGISAVGASMINWDKLAIIVGSWFVAPAVSILFSVIFFTAVAGLTLNSDSVSFSCRLFWQQFICGFASVLVYVMIVQLISEEGKEVMLTKGEWCLMPLIFLIGVLVTRLSYVFIVVKDSSLTAGLALKIVFMVWDNKEIDD